MRTNPRTIMLALIRKEIRKIIKYYNKDKGLPNFYTSTSYMYSKVESNINKKEHYYVKSDKAIEDGALKIYKIVRMYLRTIRLRRRK